MLGDFTIFWKGETDPTAKRQFLSLIFENVWLDQDRVVAVQPKPSFLAFFQSRRAQPRETAGVCTGATGVEAAFVTTRSLSRFGFSTLP